MKNNITETPSGIIQIEHPVLRSKAAPVALEEIGSKKIKKILSDMKKALEIESDGVAIAAPQIGVPLRIFVVSKRVFDIIEDLDDNKKTEKKSKKETSKEYTDLVFINPVITKLSKEKKPMEEGCLSVRWKYGNVERSEKATVTALDENGKKITLGAKGLLAQVFQHETDHLDGIIFTDKAKNVVDIPPEKLIT